ncbi:flagellar hook assembly protein FlgD [Phenylobacterium sp.]|uniref:flagellar hook assembly protein FlgD n=1 Tax=Phenylobacterium sp. TaxID=1871053 RepID=UPI0035B3169F
MAVDPTASSGGTSATSSGSATLAGHQALASNFDTFLSLLTTQLKNQDPLSPLDSTQFTQQLVQMSGVEQQLLTNDLLQSLVNTAGRGIADAVSLIGKEVRAVSDDATIQNGKATWAYKQDRDASAVKVEVLDSTGRVVHAENITDTAAGEHSFTWNGTDLTGKQLSDGGTYTLRVTAVDGNANTVPTTTYIDGPVTAVEQSDGQTLITVSGTKVVWDKVTKIATAGDGSTSSSSSTTDNTNNSTDTQTSSSTAA